MKFNLIKELLVIINYIRQRWLLASSGAPTNYTTSLWQSLEKQWLHVHSLASSFYCSFGVVTTKTGQVRVGAGIGSTEIHNLL